MSMSFFYSWRIKPTFLLLIVHLALIFNLNIVRAGFTAEVCDSTDPSDTTSIEGQPVRVKQNVDSHNSPVQIMVNPSFYRKGSQLKVTLDGIPFLKFILQAKKLGGIRIGSESRVGKFLEPLPDEAEFLACKDSDPHSVVTHLWDNTTKNLLAFTFEPPSEDVGSFEFIATFVNETAYWQDMVSNTVNFKLFPPSLTDCGKSKGCFVHQTSNEECIEGGCDVVAINHVDKERKIASFTLGRKTPSNLGYIGVAFTDDKETMEELFMIACIQVDKKEVEIKAFIMEDRTVGFKNLSDVITAKSNGNEGDMMWCEFKIQLSKLDVVKHDLHDPKYRLYITGNLDETKRPQLPRRDQILVSEEPMKVDDLKFIRYSGDSSASITYISLPSCILSMLLFYIIY